MCNVTPNSPFYFYFFIIFKKGIIYMEIRKISGIANAFFFALTQRSSDPNEYDLGISRAAIRSEHMAEVFCQLLKPSSVPFQEQPTKRTCGAMYVWQGTLI